MDDDFYETGSKMLLPTGSRYGAPYYGVIILDRKWNYVEELWEHLVKFADGSEEWTIAEMWEYDPHEEYDVEFFFNKKVEKC